MRFPKSHSYCFWNPPSLDPRIINQFALFSLMSDPGLSLRDWLDEHCELAKQVVIPAKLKLEIRDKLDQSGITERTLYPGADGLARWLSRYYGTPSNIRCPPEHPRSQP